MHRGIDELFSSLHISWIIYGKMDSDKDLIPLIFSSKYYPSGKKLKISKNESYPMIMVHNLSCIRG